MQTSMFAFFSVSWRRPAALPFSNRNGAYYARPAFRLTSSLANSAPRLA